MAAARLLPFWLALCAVLASPVRGSASAVWPPTTDSRVIPFANATGNHLAVQMVTGQSIFNAQPAFSLERTYALASLCFEGSISQGRIKAHGV